MGTGGYWKGSDVYCCLLLHLFFHLPFVEDFNQELSPLFVYGINFYFRIIFTPDNCQFFPQQAAIPIFDSDE